jgi:dimethylaniline monooxygenase (N-oxide forming)
MVVFCFQRIENKRVYFINGNSAEFDVIVFCTGYKIDLPFLSSEVKKTILDENSNDLKVNFTIKKKYVGSSVIGESSG